MPEDRLTFQAREAVTTVLKAPKADKAPTTTPFPKISPEAAPDGAEDKKDREV